MTRNILTGIVIGIISLNIYAQNKQEKVNTLLEKTGAKAEINQLDAVFSAKISEKQSKFENQDNFVKFKKIMTSNFNSENIEKYFKEYLINNSDVDSLNKIITMYNNPLIQKMNEIELKANDPENQKDKMTFFQNIKSNPPSQKRIQQLVQLNNELGTSEMSVKMLKNIIFSMANGANLSQPIEKQISSKDLKAKLESKLPPNFSQQMTNQVVALSIYTYKDINDEDLSEYIKLWSNPIGKYYIKMLFGAYDYSFSKIGKNTGKLFEQFEKK